MIEIAVLPQRVCLQFTYWVVLLNVFIIHIHYTLYILIKPIIIVNTVVAGNCWCVTRSQWVNDICTLHSCYTNGSILHTILLQGSPSLNSEENWYWVKEDQNIFVQTGQKSCWRVIYLRKTLYSILWLVTKLWTKYKLKC